MFALVNSANVFFEPCRTLHLVHSEQRRGAEVFASQLASSIQQGDRFDNGVCTLYKSGEDSPFFEGFPVFRLEGQPGALDRLGLDPGLLARLLRVLRDFQPDIIVAHGSDTLKYSASASMFYRKAATIYRNIGTASVWADSAVRVRLNRMFLRRMDAIVSVSQYTRQDFIRVYGLPETKVTFIPNGTDAIGFDSIGRTIARSQVRQELALSERDMVLVSVGNLSEEKGQSQLLTILDDLTHTGLENHLLLVGGGPLRHDLEQRARQLGLDNLVHFLGKRGDIPRLMAAADLLVLPSKTEGMPAVLIEAGMAGLPSVAFDVGGVAEVLDHGVTGILIAPGDLAGFGEALAKLCLDQDYRTRMGDAAQQRCRDLFDIRKVAMEYEELFLKMLKAAPREGNGNS